MQPHHDAGRSPQGRADHKGDADGQINIDSEIGALNAVMVHRPGKEIENMTPASAAEVLYDDILNLQLASREHDQLTGVLSRVADVYEFEDLLHSVTATVMVDSSTAMRTTMVRSPSEYFTALSMRLPTAPPRIRPKAKPASRLCLECRTSMAAMITSRPVRS